MLLSLVVACGTSPPTSTTNGKQKSQVDGHKPKVVLVSAISRKRLDAAIELAAEYLRKHVRKNGQFVYETHPNPAVVFAPEYNILRHCGTLYALAHYHAHAQGDMTSLVRATGFITTNCLDELDADHPRILAMWSPPEFTQNGRPRQAKLGGAGLGLVAFATIEKVKPGLVPLQKSQRLAEFVLYMQKKDGSYYSVFYPFEGGRDSSWTSLYYPGEAAFGLLMLYERDKDQRWLDAAARTVNYLVTSQEKKKQVLKDHWILLTLERLLPLYDRAGERIERGRILRHARRTLTMFLAEQEPQRGDKDYEGSFTSDGLTNPCATRLEGMLAALRFLPEDEIELRQKLVNAIQAGIRFLLKSQYQQGPLRGGLPRAIKTLPEGHKYYSVTYNRIAPSVRIDNVQHALSAWLRFREVFKLSE